MNDTLDHEATNLVLVPRPIPWSLTRTQLGFRDMCRARIDLRMNQMVYTWDKPSSQEPCEKRLRVARLASRHSDLGSSPGSATSQLCELGQVT